MEITFIDRETGWMVSSNTVVRSGVELVQDTLTDLRTGEVHDGGLRSPQIPRDIGAWVRSVQPKPVIRPSKVQRQFVQWDPEKQYSYIAEPSEYSTASGHKVALRRLHVDYFLLGIMEGHPDCLRAYVLSRVRGEVSIVIKEPPEGQIPRYIIRALLSRYPSERTVCWFSDELLDLHDQIVANVGLIDWGKETAGDVAMPYDDY